MKFKLTTLALASSVLLSSSLLAAPLEKVSFYVNYKPGVDTSAYALVMPSAKKIYTHTAGDLTNLKDITDQFSAFPTFSNGEVCFNSLTATASGENGASDAAGSCFTTNFYYIQKDAATLTFLLFYAPKNQVQEGTAGQPSSFAATTAYPDFYLDTVKGSGAAITAEDAETLKAAVEPTPPANDLSILVPPNSGIVLPSAD